MPNFTEEMFYLLRVALALTLGFLIGLERKTKYKEAGIRTHAIVCAGSALIMVVSKYGFGDSDTADKARVASQIVTGIGFLGAGIIVYRKSALRGLTTAAGVWMTAGVGMTVGAGMLYLGMFATVLLIAIQLILNIPIRAFKTKRFFHVRLKFTSINNEVEQIKEIFQVKKLSRVIYERNKDSEKLSITADIYINEFISEERLGKIISENDFIVSLERVVE